MIRKYFKIKKGEKGFTLIETFVAIVILMTVVLGPMSLLSTALRDARYIGNEITITYLAQEGTELMMDYRNNQGSAFNNLPPGRYYFDNLMTDPSLCPPAPAVCPLLNYDNNKGYQYNAGTPSLFYRTIEVSQIVPSQQFLIVSSVNWTGSTRPAVVSSSIIFRKI